MEIGPAEEDSLLVEFGVAQGDGAAGGGDDVAREVEREGGAAIGPARRRRSSRMASISGEVSRMGKVAAHLIGCLVVGGVLISGRDRGDRGEVRGREWRVGGKWVRVAGR